MNPCILRSGEYVDVLQLLFVHFHLHQKTLTLHVPHVKATPQANAADTAPAQHENDSLLVSRFIY